MPSPTEEDILEEQKQFANVLTTFQQYATYSLAANNRRRKDLYSLSREDQLLLTELGYKQKLIDIDQAILVNAQFIGNILQDPSIFANADLVGEDELEDRGESEQPTTATSHSHEHGHSHDHGHHHSHEHGSADLHGHTPHEQSKAARYRPTDFDMDKIRSTLKQFVRDWSEEGKVERDLCYEPLKEALVKHFSSASLEERAKLRVLVPGAGLGRLAYDIACLGFSCQGNEFSHYMLLASFFILNRTERLHEHTIHPYVHTLSNLPNSTAALRPITIPDVLPSAIPKNVNFSLVAGDFEEVYGAEDQDEEEPQAGQWDAIVTCFFIDTAKNVINYLRIFNKILAPGGVWINLGPLLWHWENNTTNDLSVELDLEEVKRLCEKMGFKLDNERTIDTTYTNNSKSMLGYVYHASFWTATKM